MQWDCYCQGEAKVRLLNFKTTWSEFHHLPQSWSKAVVCIRTPRSYPQSGYFLVLNILNRAILNILHLVILRILHKESSNMLHRTNNMLHRAAYEKTFHAFFSLFLLALDCNHFYYKTVFCKDSKTVLRFEIGV